MVRRHRRPPACSRPRQPRQGQERLRPRADRQDARRPAGCGRGRWPSRRRPRTGPRLEVHALGDLAGLHQGGRREDLGGWARAPARQPAVDVRDPRVQEGRPRRSPTSDPDAIAAAPIDNPGTTKRPGLPGVQYVGVPEFQDVGNQCTQQFSAVIAGTSRRRRGAEELPGHRVRSRMTATEPPRRRWPPHDTADQLTRAVRSRRRRSSSESWRRRLPLLPALIFTIALTQIPFVMSICLLALTDWNFAAAAAARVRVVRQLPPAAAATEFFRAAIWVSVQLTAWPPCWRRSLLGPAFALLLDRKFLGQGVVRTLLITPFLIMPVVVGADLEEPDVRRPLRHPQLGHRDARRRRRSTVRLALPALRS